MQLHRNAKLGLSGRFALVHAIESGCSIREAARRHGVSPATACTWWRRWREASAQEQETLSCLHDRSSRPHRCPRMLSPAQQERICESRRRTGWGPRLIAGALGHPHSTVSKTLKRKGCSRPQPKQREPANRLQLSSTGGARRSFGLSPAVRIRDTRRRPSGAPGGNDSPGYPVRA